MALLKYVTCQLCWPKGYLFLASPTKKIWIFIWVQARRAAGYHDINKTAKRFICSVVIKVTVGSASKKDFGTKQDIGQIHFKLVQGPVISLSWTCPLALGWGDLTLREGRWCCGSLPSLGVPTSRGWLFWVPLVLSVCGVLNGHDVHILTAVKF